MILLTRMSIPGNGLPTDPICCSSPGSRRRHTSFCGKVDNLKLFLEHFSVSSGKIHLNE